MAAPKPLLRKDAPHSASRPHWNDLARFWRLVGSPLRPVAEDLARYEAPIAEWSESGRPPRGLILGVTPELFNLPWPAGASVAAVDKNQEMIDQVWPGPRDAAVRADWTALPFPPKSRDIVLCDGGLIMLPFPEGTAALVRRVKEILAPGGFFVCRLYVPAEMRESPEAVLDDLTNGAISNVNVLKLRLGMALQDGGRAGVRLGDVWKAIAHAAPDLEAIAVRSGWPAESVATLEPYRDSDARYHFLHVAEVCDLFTRSPGGFELRSALWPSYLLGERCPTFVFRRVIS